MGGREGWREGEYWNVASQNKVFHTACLVEVDHEGRESHRDRLSGVDASEDLIHQTNPGRLSRHKAAHMSQEHDEAHL